MQTPFPHILTVLFDVAPTLDALAQALAKVGGQPRPEPRGTGWTIGHPGVLIPGNDERPGVFVDILPCPWPDGLGTDGRDPALLEAVQTGAFGTATAPGALARAISQAVHWPEAAVSTATHQAFLRIRTSPAFPGTDPGPLITWRHLTGIAALLLAMPSSTAWFAPCGEVLHSRTTLMASLQSAAQGDHLPIDLWSGLRMFRLGDPDGWAVMDTVGMAGLGGQDAELCFRPDVLSPQQAGAFLRNFSLYLIENKKPVEDGHTLEGPGVRLQVRVPDRSLVPPRRSVWRLFPVGGRPVPTLLMRDT